MPQLRISPHQPLPGSVDARNAARLLRVRTRVSRRWQRRRRRQRVFLAFALLTLAATVVLLVLFVVTPADAGAHRVLERIAFGALLFMGLGVATFAIWRFDRIRRRARSAHIRLQQVRRRIAALPAHSAAADSSAHERDADA